MSELADHLISSLKGRLSGQSLADWEEVLRRLWKNETLESAIAAIADDSSLVNEIVKETGALISCRERACFDRLLSGNEDLPLARLWPHMILNNSELHVVTTNYDRLIEFSAELAGFEVDTSFIGLCYGTFAPKISRQRLLAPRQSRRANRILLAHRPHIVLHKPQGSLDWYLHQDKPIRCPHPVGLPRLIITPGRSKYRKGYDSPFDAHRDAANAAIDKAARFLILGYGFNDDQLETHLRRRLRAGAPCLLLTKTLTPNAEQLVADCETIITLSEQECSGIKGTKSRSQNGLEFLPNEHLWDLRTFISEVLE